MYMKSWNSLGHKLTLGMKSKLRQLPGVHPFCGGKVVQSLSCLGPWDSLRVGEV